MNTDEIARLEETNTDRVYLHREGTFLRAYEHSAFLLWKHVSTFRLRRRFIKKINRHLIFLGFPEYTKDKWLHGMRLEETSPKLIICHIGEKIDEAEYLQFEEEARVQTQASDRYTPRRNIIERQEVYQTAFSLNMYCRQIAKNLPKTDLVPYGNDLKTSSYYLAMRTGKLYDYPDRGNAVTQLQGLVGRVEFALKVLREAHTISETAFAEAGQMAESVRDQLEALRFPGKKKTAKNKDTGQFPPGT